MSAARMLRRTALILLFSTLLPSEGMSQKLIFFPLIPAPACCADWGKPWRSYQTAVVVQIKLVPGPGTTTAEEFREEDSRNVMNERAAWPGMICTLQSGPGGNFAQCGEHHGYGCMWP